MVPYGCFHKLGVFFVLVIKSKSLYYLASVLGPLMLCGNSHNIPNMAVLSYTSNLPETDIVSYSGLCMLESGKGEFVLDRKGDMSQCVKNGLLSVIAFFLG